MNGASIGRSSSSFAPAVAIVTGAGSGIGRQMCWYLARRGATVVVADVDGDAAARVAGEVDALGGRGAAVTVDVADVDRVRDLVTGTVAQHGRIDLLINNAGVGLDGEFQDTTLDQWRRVVDVNLWGVVYGTYLVYPIMMDQGFGQIVNVSSLAGLLPGGLMTSYTAAKHAVTGFTLGLRPEAQEYGVKINLLCPGFLETPLHDATPVVTPYLKAPQNQRNPHWFPPAEDCIDQMMRGIAADRAVIVAPHWQRVFWWAYRLLPGLAPVAWRQVIRRLRKAADPAPARHPVPPDRRRSAPPGAPG